MRQCEPKVWIIPTHSAGIYVSIRRALYCLIKDGFQRVRGEQAKGNQDIILNYRLTRSYHSGQILWMDSHGTGYRRHPGLWKRLDIQHRRWVWQDAQGRVHYVEEIG